MRLIQTKDRRAWRREGPLTVNKINPSLDEKDRKIVLRFYGKEYDIEEACYIGQDGSLIIDVNEVLKPPYLDRRGKGSFG